MKKLIITISLILGAVTVSAQGDLSNQVLRLLSRINTWSALNTYTAGTGVILLGRQSVPLGTRTDRLENIGGNLYFNGTVLASSSSAGTVTSVALALPNIFTVSGSPVTSSGTLTGTLATQTANKVLASGTSGGAATPAFRALVNADFPTSGVSASTYPKVTVNAQGIVTAGVSQITLTTDVTGILPLANGGTGLSSASDDTVMVSNGSAWQAKALSNCLSGAFTYNASTNTFGCNIYVTVGTTSAGASTNIRLTETTSGVLSVLLGDGSGIADIGARRLALGSGGSTTFDTTHYSIMNLVDTWTAALTVQPLSFLRVVGTVTQTGAATKIANAASMVVTSASASNQAGLEALDLQALYNGSAVVTNLNALSVYNFISSGTATEAYGIYAASDGTGTIGTNYVAYIDSVYEALTVTNHYGVYINDQTVAGATVDYALFYNGPSSFGVDSDGNVLAEAPIYLGAATTAPLIEAAAGAPGGTCVTGSIYARTNGGTGTSDYWCDNTAWTAFGSIAGILTPAKGGTGFDGSAAANGRLPIGNGAGFTLAGLTGTADQVVVTNGAGTITLSTPQSINTTSTPRFARLGLGTGAGATAVLTTTGTFDTGYFNAGSSGATLTLTLTNGMTQKTTLTADCTFALSGPISGTVYTLVLIQDGTGSRLVTWPGSVTWAGGAAPTLTTGAGKADIIRLLYNGSTYYGSVVGQNY